MDDDDFNEEEAPISFLDLFGDIPAQKNRRFRKIDVAVLALLAAHNLSDAVTNTLAATYNKLASHANFERDQEDMLEEATREIETLTGDDNG